MKVLQLIDSLEAGGAERVAVNYANGLLNYVDESFLCATRAEGLLKSSLSKEVGYLFLKRTKTIDIAAIKKLSRFVKINDIDIIHAHASSFFLATIIKLLNPNLKLVWHDHYGKSEFLSERPKGVLKFCSIYFDYIYSVNFKLETWAKINLKAKSVSYLPNFAVKREELPATTLEGSDGKRIVCLANFRPQKDHLNLLKAFKGVQKIEKDWSLHLIGQDFKDSYSQAVVQFIKDENLKKSVFLYGSCPDISAVLGQCNLGVLSSKSEGLPLALLEYGLANLPVVATNVGDCKIVISNDSEGQIVASENSLKLQQAILFYINNTEKANLAAINLNKKVESQFSENSILNKVIATYQSIIS